MSFISSFIGAAVLQTIVVAAEQSEAPKPIDSLPEVVRTAPLNLEIPNRTIFHQEPLSPERVQEFSLRSQVDNFSGCIFTPIPIDDRYVGCRIILQPTEGIENDR